LALADAEGLDEDDGLDVLLLVPDVPAVLELDGAVFRMNFVSLEALLLLPDVPVEPDVPVGLELPLARSIHPVRVTLSDELELGDCEDVDGGVVWAAAIATVQTIAANVPNHTFLVIVSS
jgi:hypothetical protein